MGRSSSDRLHHAVPIASKNCLGSAVPSLEMWGFRAESTRILAVGPSWLAQLSCRDVRECCPEPLSISLPQVRAKKTFGSTVPNQFDMWLIERVEGEETSVRKPVGRPVLAT